MYFAAKNLADLCAVVMWAAAMLRNRDICFKLLLYML